MNQSRGDDGGTTAATAHRPAGLRLVVARARNDLLFDDAGRAYIDMFTAHGTTWMGHGNVAVKEALAEQLEKVWITGALETAVRSEAEALAASFFPASHTVAGLYSTGMEAAEFALRLARVATGRAWALGFERGMHGKSTATSFLCWDNRDGLDLPQFQRLPFVPTYPEGQILDRLEHALGRREVSAVFVEPLQGSGGGHRASDDFYRALHQCCRAHGTLLVFDEILTGFYRTGRPFVFSGLGFVPDVVLIGKAMGNGFPVSGVVVDRGIPIRAAMLPGSTYAGNALAAAAVLASLRQIRAGDLSREVARIEEAIVRVLGPVRDAGIALRGQGAIWIL
jgi:acetylornithine/succinyldiaminopimelate/putrescine aminotransferase